MYLGLRNVRFSNNFVYVLNGSSIKIFLYSTKQFFVIEIFLKIILKIYDLGLWKRGGVGVAIKKFDGKRVQILLNEFARYNWLTVQ